MKTFVTLITLLALALPSLADVRMQPLDKDIPLAEGIRQANELFPDVQPLTEQEVIAAVQAIKLKHSDIKEDVYETYMRVVREKVLPKGMFFSRITTWNTEYGRFEVDWKDLCLEGRVATAEERQEALSKIPTNIKTSGEIWVGGFAYRIRARFVSSSQQTQTR